LKFESYKDKGGKKGTIHKILSIPSYEVEINKILTTRALIKDGMTPIVKYLRDEKFPKEKNEYTKVQWTI
jgi:hypothetical protein